MIKFRKLILVFILASLALFIPLANAHDDELEILFFYGEGCPHCAEQEIFLDELESKYGEHITIERYEVWHHPENVKILKEKLLEHNIDITGKPMSVPVTIVGQQVFSGYSIQVKKALGEICVNAGLGSCEEPANSQETSSDSISLPLIGEVDLKKFSLPVLTIIIAGLDGFNPCAMWVLIFLITLLLGMENRTRMWVLGSAFIISSGLVYFLFLTAWLNLIQFLAFIAWIRIVIGTVAVASGVYHLREYIKNKDGVCKVTSGEKRQKIFGRLKEAVSTKNFWLALGGIVILAVAVNMVELVCSAGLPAVYTQVLSLTEMPTYAYYLYLLLYIVIFMLDDMLIFVLAMTSLKVVTMNNKYTKYSNLFGGIIILILGLLLIFKPEWIMFG